MLNKCGEMEYVVIFPSETEAKKRWEIKFKLEFVLFDNNIYYWN